MKNCLMNEENSKNCFRCKRDKVKMNRRESDYDVYVCVL